MSQYRISNEKISFSFTMESRVVSKPHVSKHAHALQVLTISIVQVYHIVNLLL